MIKKRFMGRNNIVFVGMIGLFPEVMELFKGQDRKEEVLSDVLENVRCVDCKHYEEKYCKGRGYRGVVQVINDCILKRAKVVSRTMMYINGRLMEIKRGQKRDDPASVVVY